MIVLDTHVLLWWASGDKSQLSSAALKAIKTELSSGQIVISSISSWEVAMLIDKGRVSLSMEIGEWIATLEQIDAVHFHAVDNDIAIRSIGLPGEFHKDPADRIIVATARKLACPLVTMDEKIRAYPHVRTIW